VVFLVVLNASNIDNQYYIEISQALNAGYMALINDAASDKTFYAPNWFVMG
jgi:hypothetical protein